MQAIAEVCALCNEAQLECKAGVFRAVGAPTEAALVCMVEKLGLPDLAEHSHCTSLRKQASRTSRVVHLCRRSAKACSPCAIACLWTRKQAPLHALRLPCQVPQLLCGGVECRIECPASADAWRCASSLLWKPGQCSSAHAGHAMVTPWSHSCRQRKAGVWLC